MCARDNGTLYREIAASVSGPPRRKLLAVAGPQISAARCESEFLNRIGRKRSSQQRYVIPGQTSVISCGRSLVSSTATRDAGPSLTPTWTVQVRLKLLGAIEHRATCSHDGPTGEPRGRRRIILAGPPLSSRGKATLGCWTTGLLDGWPGSDQGGRAPWVQHASHAGHSVLGGAPVCASRYLTNACSSWAKRCPARSPSAGANQVLLISS